MSLSSSVLALLTVTVELVALGVVDVGVDEAVVAAAAVAAAADDAAGGVVSFVSLDLELDFELDLSLFLLDVEEPLLFI